MAIIGAEVYDYLGKKPKPVNEERLKQAARVNMLGNVFNLISQGVMGKKGATINPMKDIVTPYVLNRFNEQRQMDIQQGERDRQLMLRQILRDQEINAGNIHKDAIRQDNLTRKEKEKADAIARQGERDVTTGNTFEQKKELAAIRAGQELKDYGAKKDIDYNHQVRVAQALSKIKKESGEGRKIDYKPVTMIKNNFPLNDTEINSLSANVADMIKSDPVMFEKLKKANPKLAHTVLRYPEELKPENWTYVINFFWDDLQDNYTDLHNELMKIYQGDVSPAGTKPKKGELDDL